MNTYATTQTTKPNNNMKKSEIKHITDTTTDPEDDPELVFTGCINEDDGGFISDVGLQPDRWENVRHLTGNLFYAFDTEAPADGIVYIGEFV
jgi:hypothetical protein